MKQIKGHETFVSVETLDRDPVYLVATFSCKSPDGSTVMIFIFCVLNPSMPASLVMSPSWSSAKAWSSIAKLDHPRCSFSFIHDIWISITPKNKNIAIGYDSLKTNTTGTGMSIYGMKISLSSFYGEIDGIFNGLNE